MELLVFALFALLALGGAIGAIAARNPVHCAIALLAALCGVAALFATLWAEFIAVVQLMVYAGGIMVLFLFVIMLVDLESRGFDREAGRIAPRTGRVHRAISVVLTVAMAAGLGVLLAGGPLPARPTADVSRQALQGTFAADGLVLGNTERIGDLLFTSYLLPFELASVTLLVAIIGATVIARRHA